MAPNSDRLVEALLRTDFRAFLDFAFRELHSGSRLKPNWHIDLMAEHCSDVVTGWTRRLIINVPPRSLKSETGSIALPAFLFGRDPAKQIMIIAGSQKLGQELMAKLARLIRSPRYKSLFPKANASATPTAIRSPHGGSIVLAMVGEQLSGRGADLIIVDDPLSPSHALDGQRRDAVNDWYDAEVRTRLNQRATGCVVVLMQRVHPEDLTAHLLAKEPFKHVSLPAIVSRDVEVRFPSQRVYKRKALEVLQPERETAEQLEARLNELGAFHFNGQYLQGDFLRWSENNRRAEFLLYGKRPDGWRPGDPWESGGWFMLDFANDIRAQYFGGYNIYSEYQNHSWMTDEEMVEDVYIAQQKLIAWLRSQDQA
jgi:hypothetical protein